MGHVPGAFVLPRARPPFREAVCITGRTVVQSVIAKIGGEGCPPQQFAIRNQHGLCAISCDVRNLVKNFLAKLQAEWLENDFEGIGFATACSGSDNIYDVLQARLP